MSSQNYWFEMLLKDADLALSYHNQTYIICESASLPKKLNKSAPGYSISVALNSQGFKGEPPLLLCRPLPLFSAGSQGFERPSIPLETGRDWAHHSLCLHSGLKDGSWAKLEGTSVPYSGGFLMCDTALFPRHHCFQWGNKLLLCGCMQRREPF